MKLIHKAVLRELLLTFILAIAFLNAILMMEKLVRLSRILSGAGATLYDMGRLILYVQPQLLMLTIPMSLLLSVLLVYGRMNMDSEIIVLKTSGMDFMDISRPVFIAGVLCFTSALFVSFYIGPKSSSRLRSMVSEIITSRSALALEEGTFNSAFKNLVILVKGKKSADSLEDIFIHDNRIKDNPRILFAKRGKFTGRESGDVALLLTDGYINMKRGTKTTEIFFERYNMVLSLDAESPGLKKMELTPSELVQQARSAETPKKRSFIYLELHRRFSLPAICLVLSFLGLPLALLSGRSGKLGGLAIGLLVFSVYYTLLIYGENLVTAEKIPHYLGAWLPSIIMSLFAGILFRRAGRQ